MDCKLFSSAIFLGIALLVTLPQQTEATIQKVKVAFLYHEGDDELEASFDEAISDLEEDPNTMVHLVPLKRKVSRNSFLVMLVVCKLISEGIAAIFGPTPYGPREVVMDTRQTYEYKFVPEW
ncbi:hypothetical protein QAD02_019875 [Eretmocerus hayati]|uniref:Uncharacterized protein n=1 Tax=Eretmocerus hayati TaxID=131215 RepID=A0ACC2PKU2_9HYME|nr:hypothetical protein QAD02_019875 [Eretmocerus hayati]